MNVKDCVKAMLKYKNTTQWELADKIGMKNQSAIGTALSRGNMTIETLVRYCEACGYEVCIQPNKITGQRPNGQFVITETGPTKKNKGGESE